MNAPDDPPTGMTAWRKLFFSGVGPFFWFLAACTPAPAPDYDPSEDRPGGATTVSVVPFPSSELPASNLPQSSKPRFFAGKALAHQPWVKAPTTTQARDGLGPLYNARSCLACHHKGGRGRIPATPDQILSSSFLRLSIPGSDATNGALAEPTYGPQLQSRSVALADQLGRDSKASAVPAEAKVVVTWRERAFVFPDGEQTSLREPEITLKDLGYGPLHPKTMMSLRLAPAIHGAGLIELIDQDDISKREDAQDADGDGISGRTNMVWDLEQARLAPGRFGHKANRSSLKVTVAGAFAGDLGITNSLFAEQPCTERQIGCLAQPSGSSKKGVEIDDDLLDLVVDFNRNLGVPARSFPRSQDALSGRERFYELGCARCHHPGYTTKTSATHPHLGNQRIWPYSDFLLHDMGTGLADGRPDFDASGAEWRTPPLWGLGVSARVSGSENYLHDGRARTIEEAILWHAGEALAAQRRYAALSKERRQQLIAFLRSL